MKVCRSLTLNSARVDSRITWPAVPLNLPDEIDPSSEVQLMVVKGIECIPLLRGTAESTVTMKLVRMASQKFARRADASIMTKFGVPVMGVPSPTFMAGTAWVTVVTLDSDPILIRTSAGAPGKLKVISAIPLVEHMVTRLKITIRYADTLGITIDKAPMAEIEKDK